MPSRQGIGWLNDAAGTVWLRPRAGLATASGLFTAAVRLDTYGGEIAISENIWARC